MLRTTSISMKTATTARLNTVRPSSAQTLPLRARLFLCLITCDTLLDRRQKRGILADTMSFMFETRFPQHLTPFAAKEAPPQDDYVDCWGSIEKKFDGTPDLK